MRTKLLTILIVLGAIFGSIAASQAQTYQWDFQKYFYLDERIEVTSCEFTQLQNGEYLYVLGVREPELLRGYFLMIRLDREFNLMMSSAIGESSRPVKQAQYIVKDVIEKQNGEFMIAGSIEKYNNTNINGQGAVLLTLDSYLNCTEFQFYENIRVWNSVLEAADGYAVCGQDFRYQGVLARWLNNNYSMIYHVDPMFAERSEFNELTTEDTKQFGAVGTLERDDSDVMIVRFDEGQVQYSNIYTHLDKTLYEKGMSIVEFKDEYVVAGSMKGQPGVEIRPIAFKVVKYNGDWMNPYSAMYDMGWKDIDVASIRVFEDQFFIGGTINTDIWGPQFHDHGFIFGFRDANPFNVIENRFYGEMPYSDAQLTDMNQNLLAPHQSVTGGYSDNMGSMDMMWIIQRYENILDDCRSKRYMPPVYEYPLHFEKFPMREYSPEYFKVEPWYKRFKVMEEVVCEEVHAKSSEIDSKDDLESSNEMKVWTNDGNLYITGAEGPFEYGVYNISGRLVEAGKSASANFVKNISSLKQGVYVVKVNTAQGIYSVKFTR